MSSQKNVWDNIQNEISKLDIDETTKKQLLKKLIELKSEKLNILIVGATGSGKSSTINALFDIEIAKVGYGVDPETMDIQKFELENLILWDSPGLGDSPEADSKHSKNITNILLEETDDGHALIDVVLVIVDGSSKDMGTSYELINKVIIPNVCQKDRILVAINQCDIAMKGNGWNYANNRPEPMLDKFLIQKVESVKRRVYDATGVKIEPIYYSALRKYNISKLLSFIIKYTPVEKRSVYINTLNKDPKVWKDNDDQDDYNEKNKKELNLSITGGLKGAAMGAAAGATVGSLIPVVGTAIGAGVGAALGFLGGLFNR
jgi:uncharacterized protein